MGAQSFLLSSSVGHGCPPRATGSPALQLPLSRMRKYWICFVKGKKNKKIIIKKSNILSAIPDSVPGYGRKML